MRCTNSDVRHDRTGVLKEIAILQSASAGFCGYGYLDNIPLVAIVLEENILFQQGGPDVPHA